MNINKYNIKYYLNNNTPNILDSNSIRNNSRDTQMNATFHKKSRNTNRQQSFSSQINESKGKHSVLLSNTIVAKTQRLYECKRNNLELLDNSSKTFINHKKQNSGNDSSFMFPLISSLNNSCNNNKKNIHRYSFDVKRKPRVRLLSNKCMPNISDSNSSLNVISDNGNVRKSSLNNQMLVVDTEDEDNNNIIMHKQLTLNIGNKSEKRGKLFKCKFNPNEDNLRTINSNNEDNNSSGSIISSKLDNRFNTSRIDNNVTNKLLLRKQPFTIINNPPPRRRRHSLQVNLLTNNLNRISKANNGNINKNNINNNKKQFRRQRESFLQQYARSLTIGEQYNYFSFFMHQVNNYEEDNISQIEAENFVNNMFELVQEAEEINKIYEDIIKCKNIDFNSSFYIKSKETIIKTFSRRIKEKNDKIENNVNTNKLNNINSSINHIRSIISNKTTSRALQSTYVCYKENNIYTSLFDKTSKKEIIKMSLNLFDKLERQFYQHKSNNDIKNQTTSMKKELVLMSYNCLLLDKYFDIKHDIEEFIFHQEYITPKQKTYFVQLTRLHTLNKQTYSKKHKIENYILASYEKKDNILYVNHYIDKDTTMYLLTNLYKHGNGQNYQRDANRKLTRFSVCTGYGMKNQQLKLSLPHSKEAKRNSTIHGKAISHTISPQRSNIIMANKNPKSFFKDETTANNEYNFIRENERKYTYSNNDTLIPYKESLLYKLTCINNQSINICCTKELSTCKEYIKSINTNKSIITNDSLFIRKKATKITSNIQETPPKQEKLPEFKESIIVPSFIQSGKNNKLNKLSSSSFNKILSLTIDKKNVNNQIENNIYKSIMFHIANNNYMIVKTKILNNKDKLQINYQNEEGDTFLIYAIKSKCYDLIQFLLEAGCDPNIANNDQNYPLHYALSLHNYEIANTLIKYGAKENSLNSNGIGPWQCVGVPLN